MNISGIFQSYLKSIVAGYSATRKLNGSANAVCCEDMRCVQHEDGIGWDIFIKMELLTPLMRALPEQVTEAHALQVGMDVCKALVLCAQYDIIHRDIKPQNIFVTPNGECKLGDFGIVQTVEKTAGGARPRDCQYMAPEVYNDQPYGVCADIYALGLVLYWLLNEKRMPFLPSAQLRPGEEEVALLRRMQGEPLPAPKNGSRELQEIVLKACACNPAHRYGTAAELLAALEGISGRVGQKAAFLQEPELEIDQPGKKPLTQTKVRKNVLCVPGVNPEIWGQKNIKRSQVTEVIFSGTLPNHLVVNAWDVSAAQDRSILAWMEGSVLHVATDGVIALNPKSVYLFYDFQNLTSIDFGDCVDTSLVTDMGGMFEDCSSLQSLDLSNFDTSQVTDMKFMFNDCRSLQSLDLRNFNTSQVTNMWCMFYGCSSLQSLDVSKFDTAQVTAMREMFQGCSSLQNLDVSGFDTSQVTDMWWMFYGCSSLRSLDLRNFNTSQVTNMSGMFNGCSSLQSLDVSKFDTSQVTNMWGMFNGCSSLQSLDVSKFDTSQVTDMWGMFNGCSSLQSLDVSNFDTAQVTDMRRMFEDCSSLRNLDLRGFKASWLTKVGEMFSGCHRLTSLKCSDNKILRAYSKR